MAFNKFRRTADQVASLFNNLTFHYNLIMVVMFGWGLYAIFADEPPTVVSVQASHNINTLFILIHVLAPPVVWAGQLIPTARVQWWLRLAGDSALSVMIATHTAAVWQLADQGVVGMLYLFFVLLGLALITWCLTIRDLIRAVGASKGCTP